jgi:hypothetical protein
MGRHRVLIWIASHISSNIVKNSFPLSVVAIFPHAMQKPGDFFALDVADLVANGFITESTDRRLLYRFVTYVISFPSLP